MNSQGKKLENKDEILSEYARYYKELLKISRGWKKKEKEEIEQIVSNNSFRNNSRRKKDW